MSEDFRGVETRTRLLEAAAAVFVEAGYRAATLREICRRAGTNNAAINYHFHDKQQLYTAVIRRELDPAKEQMPQFAVDPHDSPEKQLRAFIRSVLACLLGSGPPTPLMKLMTRELGEPTAALDLLVNEAVRPIHEALCGIVRKVLGADAADQLVTDCVRSIMAQCLIYDNSRAIIVRMGHYAEYDQATIEHLADHIVAFSLGGIRAMADRRDTRGPQRGCGPS
jgi:TetR/AcrR family transcriptional regulator, regulator of cefoperazone and chloramphenicol sensitivity